MRKIFTCKICGHSSEFQQNITTCEKLGKPNLYDYGWTVSFMRDYHKKEGVIIRVSFTQQRHKPIYGVNLGGVEVSVLEDHILEGFPPPPSAA